MPLNPQSVAPKKQPPARKPFDPPKATKRKPFDPPPKPKTAAKPAPKPKLPTRPKVAFGSKPQIGPPKPVEPKTIFGPKIKPARVTFAKKLAKVRKQYLGGAERRNKAAIKVGIKARTQQAGPADMQGAPTSAPPTEAILQAIVALNEVLLTPTAASELVEHDAHYLTHCKRAQLTESLSWKGLHHQRASKRAALLGSMERAERHQTLATAFQSLASD